MAARERHILEPVAPRAKWHPMFQALLELPGYAPARGMISEIWETFEDVDGNFVEQFQTTALDARVWELYWHAFLTSEGFALNRRLRNPDFVATKDGRTVCIEVVTVNATQGGPPEPSLQELLGELPPNIDLHDHTHIRELTAASRARQAVKYGSALTSKLGRRYWELPHVQGNPFVLAIEDFHEGVDSLLAGSCALGTYLYGDSGAWRLDDDGNLVVGTERVDRHKSGQKDIPSGFFRLPEAEHVSAVIYSNAGTLPKFNRMGHQGKYRATDVRMFRRGTYYDTADPNAVTPGIFSYEVGDGTHYETWGEGLEVFHNPNAKVPLPMPLLGDVFHVERDAQGVVRGRYREPCFHPFGSFTYVLQIQRESGTTSA